VRERRLEHLAGVVRGAAHLRHVPVRAQVRGAQARVGLEAARREHDRTRAQLLAAAVRPAHHDAPDRARLVPQEVVDRRLVAHLDAGALRGGAVLGHEPLAAVDRAEHEAAPEAVAAVDLVGLALVHEPEAHAALAQPVHRRPGVVDEDLRHRLVAAAERDAAHVGPELLGRVRVEVGARAQVVVEALGDPAQVVEPVVRDADRAGGEGRVAARPLEVGLLEHEHAAPALARRMGGGHAGVAGAHHDDVVVVSVHGPAS
jgi:hypothetical protein